MKGLTEPVSFENEEVCVCITIYRNTKKSLDEADEISEMTSVESFLCIKTIL